jgi:mono/diheme cytochrome c family protein
MGLGDDAAMTKIAVTSARKIPVAMQTFGAVLTMLTVAWLASCASPPDPGAMAAGGRARSRPERAPHEGARLYKVSCSGCHGADAHGNGPIAPILKVPVPDLTLIAARRGGAFPEDEIYQIIDGQADLSAHGPRHMPVWGYEFFGDEPDDEAAHRAATEKIERLLNYLRSIQRPG